MCLRRSRDFLSKHCDAAEGVGSVKSSGDGGRSSSSGGTSVTTVPNGDGTARCPKSLAAAG